MKKRENLDTAIYLAFLTIIVMLFCDVTVFIQKWYWQHSIYEIWEATLINAIIGLVEGINLTNLLGCNKLKIFSTNFEILISSISLLILAFSFMNRPGGTYEIAFWVGIIILLPFICERLIWRFLFYSKNRH